MPHSKKYIYLVLIAATLLLTQCVVAPVQQAEPAAAPAAPAQPAAKPYAGTTLKFAAQFHPSVEGVKPLLKEFEDATGIKVEIDEYPYPDIVNKQEIAYSSGQSSFDVGMMDPLILATWFNAGWVTPLDDFVADPKLTDNKTVAMDDFLDKAMVQMKDPKTGKLMGLPIYAESIELMFRKDLLEQKGLQVPTNMEELATVATKLKDGDMPGIILRGERGAGLNVYIWTSFLKAFGGDYFDKNYKPLLDSPEAIAAAEYYAKLLNAAGPPGAASIGWEPVLTNMQQGKAAMIIDATVFAGPLESQKDSLVKGKVGYASVPAGPKGAVPSLAAWGAFIPKDSKNKEAAWQFIQWLTSENIQMRSAVIGPRSDVTRKSVWNSPEFKALKSDWGDWSDVTLKSLEAADPEYRPRISNWPEVGDRLGVSLSEIISGQKPAAQALQEANKDITDMMIKAGYYKP